jgi:hypothetical protein
MLDRNRFNVDSDEIHRVPVERTYLADRLVRERQVG